MRVILLGALCALTVLCDRTAYGHKDSDKDDNDHPFISFTEEHDGCKREFPLTAENKQQVPLAFNQYGITPALIAVARTIFRGKQFVFKYIIVLDTAIACCRLNSMASSGVSRTWATK